MPELCKDKVIGLDCETTGTDLYHGAFPFLVTFFDGQINKYFEWEVDPHKRIVLVDPDDLDAIQDEIDAADTIVLQNGKFDVSALTLLFSSLGKKFRWDWSKAEDTLMAGHILASNQKHDLTSMVMQYLGIDILPFENDMEEACKETRKLAKNWGWRIATFGDDDMPSIKKSGNKVKAETDDRPWKFDCWLPRAAAMELLKPESHPWWTVTSKYANADSSTTWALWPVMEKLLRDRGYWNIYKHRMELPGIISRMERRGATVRLADHTALVKEFSATSERNAKDMVEIAKTYNHILELPKGSVNNNLRTLIFDRMKLEHIYNNKSKTAAPTLDAKNAIPHYLFTLPQGSRELKFVQLLEDKRAKDNALSYLASYERFWIPSKDVCVLHASLNPTATDTLRFNMVKPNLQQVSKKNRNNVRKCFGPGPGREWWALDYENIELRIPAYEAKEPDLIALFERPDEPPYYGSEHILNFETVYGDIWAKIVKEVGIEKAAKHIKETLADTWYQRCKNGDFAIQYNCGVRTADMAFGKSGCFAKLKARFARKEKLNQYWIAYANKFGYVETLPDKTVDPKRGYPLLCTRTPEGRILTTVPLSYHVQSTAMQCTAKGMVRGDAYLEDLSRKRKKLYYMTLQVHDEIVLDFPKGGKANLPYVQEFARLMEMSGDDIGVPLKVSISYHPLNWATKEKVPA